MNFIEKLIIVLLVAFIMLRFSIALFLLFMILGLAATGVWAFVKVMTWAGETIMAIYDRMGE